MLQLGPDDDIRLADQFRGDYRHVRVLPSTVGGKGVYGHGHDPGWRDKIPCPTKNEKLRYIGKIERDILRLLNDENEWMKRPFRPGYSPHVLMDQLCSLDLMNDRKRVAVYGHCTQKTVIKMIRLGVLKGTWQEVEHYGGPEFEVEIELEGEAAKAAMDCNTARDLIYVAGSGYVFRRNVA